MVVDESGVIAVDIAEGQRNDAPLALPVLEQAKQAGKPCVRGLRYPVETLLELLSSGMSTEAILADSEDLERADLLAVLSFAARLVRTRRLQPSP